MSNASASHPAVPHRASKAGVDAKSPALPAASRTQEQANNRAELNSTSAFLDVLRMTLKWEGGYDNDPDDPGKATMCGITQATYNRFCKSQNLPQQHVSGISKHEIHTIYKKFYWDESGCNNLPRKIAAVNFDTAVNCGTGGAQRVMQRALKLCGFSYDQLALLTPGQEAEFLSAHTQARMERYQGICERWEANGKPRAWKYMDGWSNRACDLAKFVGVASDELTKIFKSATIACANGTARDWVMPSNWSAGSGNLIMSLFGGFSRFGGSVVGFFGNLINVPEVQLQFDQLEKPPYDTRCLEQVENLPEKQEKKQEKIAKKLTADESRKTSLIEQERKLETSHVALRDRLKHEQQELQAALSRQPRSKKTEKTE